MLFALSDPRQQQIHGRLARLVGQNAADFYRDACRLMSGSIDPPLTTTTNMVAHALREVESALRQVLAPLAARRLPTTAPTATAEVPADTEEEIGRGTHKEQVIAALTGLRIPLNDELAKAWLAIPGGKGPHSYAHRRSLRPTRVLDDEFQELWATIEAIFHGVLDRFEAQYLVIFDTVDALARKENPARTDAQYFAESIPNNFVAHTKFFEQLTNPKWLAMLRAKSIFRDPPAVEYGFDNGTTTMRYPSWPATTYLRKMAAEEPTLVKDILLDVAETDNANVKGELLEIAADLPKEERLSLVDRIKSWTRSEQSGFVTDGAGSVISNFVDEGELAVAVDISKSLLGFHIVSRSPTIGTAGQLYTPSPEVRSQLDEWQYGQFMEKEFRKIATSSPQGALDLAVALLEEFLSLSYPDRLSGEVAYRDYTYINRPAIEDHVQNGQDGEVENHLIVAARDITTEFVAADPANLGDVARYLKRRRWSVFTRLALHVAAEVANPDPVVIRDLLLDESSLSGSEIWHEYTRLLARHFRILGVEDKQIFFSWIERAAALREPTASKTEEEIERRRELWQLERLTIVRDHLDIPWNERRETLVAKYGEPEHPDFLTYTTEGDLLSESVHSAQDLLKMIPDDVIKLLMSWTPSATRSFFLPSREGLARELSSAMHTDPEFFAGKEEAFEGLHPTYVSSFIQASQDSARNGRSLNWDSMLRLCTWAIAQPNTVGARTDGGKDRDPDWHWTRRAISSLAGTGLRRNDIPYELRERVWNVIAVLLDDRDPVANEEGEPIAEDAYSRAINSVRGCALELAVQYGLWVRRQQEKAGRLLPSLEEMPELRGALEKHLDDRSTAVRSIYGRFLPWLLLIDKEWTEGQLERVFPRGLTARPLRLAVWDAYVLYTSVYSNVFPSLRGQYQAAIDDLAGAPLPTSRSRDPQRKLVEHLFVTYWRGVISLDDPLLTTFWKNASKELRGYVMDFIGHALRTMKEPLQVDAEMRLKALWTERHNAAVEAKNKADYQEEMSGFGSWFGSGQLEEKWASQQYLLALEFGSRNTALSLVAKRLVGLIDSLPHETLCILGKIIDLPQPNWAVLGSRNEIESLLRVGLQSSDELSHKMAREIINRLAARGNSTLAALAREFPEL